MHEILRHNRSFYDRVSDAYFDTDNPEIRQEVRDRLPNEITVNKDTQ